MIRNLIKIILIILLLTAPASCEEEMTKPIIIEDAANIGAVDITLTYDASLFVITDVTDGGFDVTESNLEHNETGLVRIGAFQTDNPGLSGQISLASVTLDGDLDDLSSLSMTVNTLSDATPQCNPIASTVDGFTITASSSTSTGSRHGGGGIDYTPAPSPTTLSAPFAAPVPVEQEPPARATPTPTHLTAFRTEPSSLPSPILSPIAGIVIVAVAAIFGIVIVTRATEDHKKATIATIGIVVVAVAAIIGMMLM